MRIVKRLFSLSVIAPLTLMASAQAFASEPFNYDGPVITIRLSHSAPATFPTIKSALDPWVESVEKESNGKIRIEKYYGGVLHSAKDGFKAAVNDITDFTPAYTMYQSGSFHLHHVLSLPFAFPNAAVASRVAEELYPKYFKKEYEAMGVYLANYSATSAYNLFTKKPVRTLEDLKGMKIRGSGGTSAAIIKALGATPVSTPATEAYTSFQRGVVDAVSFYDTGALGYRVHEISKYATELNLHSSALAYAFNKKSFDSYPPEVKRFLYRKLRQLNQWSGNAFDQHDQQSRKLIEASGVQYIKLSAEELARWRQAVEPLWEAFIQENEAKGLPARQLVADLRALVKKYEGWTQEQLMQAATDDPVRGIIDGM